MVGAARSAARTKVPNDATQSASLGTFFVYSVPAMPQTEEVRRWRPNKKSRERAGQRPGSMHIDRRAARLLGESVSDGPDEQSLTTQDVADWLGVSTQFLEIARHRGDGPNASGSVLVRSATCAAKSGPG